MRHATDPDHVIAVTTIVSRQRNLLKAALTGIFWGIGHTFTIFVVGTAIILFDVVIPARIGLSMEFSVGLMLIVLGGMNIASFMRTARTIAPPGEESDLVHSHPHIHGDFVHNHAHSHGPENPFAHRSDTSDLAGPVVWQDRSLPTVAPVGRGNRSRTRWFRPRLRSSFSPPSAIRIGQLFTSSSSEPARLAE